jgi:hypothetical protein
VSTVIWVVVGLWLFAQRPEPPEDPAPPPASVSGLDAATLTAAGAFVTSVGSLVAIVLSHLKSQREMELEHQMREKELELERAKLELERLKMEARREKDDGH